MVATAVVSPVVRLADVAAGSVQRGADNPPSYRDSSRCNALRWSTGSHPVGRGRCSRNSRRRRPGLRKRTAESAAGTAVVATAEDSVAMAGTVESWEVAVGSVGAGASLAWTEGWAGMGAKAVARGSGRGAHTNTLGLVCQTQVTQLR